MTAADILAARARRRRVAQRGRAGLTAAREAEAELWWRQANAALEVLAASGEPFTADDLRLRAGDPPRGHQLSAVFGTAKCRRKIRAVGVTVGRGGWFIRRWTGVAS